MLESFEASKPVPSNTPPTSPSFPNSFTKWGPSIQIREPLRAILIPITTALLFTKILKYLLKCAQGWRLGGETSTEFWEILIFLKRINRKQGR